MARTKGSSAHPQAPSAWLFVDDDEHVVRFPLSTGEIRIGRAHTNDIWLEHPGVPPRALTIVRRDGDDLLRVLPGAKVTLNDEPFDKADRLYSGDRIGLADREFLYAREDAVPDCALGMTISRGDRVLRAVVIRRARVRVGRRDADVMLGDPSVSDRHLLIEAIASDALFVSHLGSAVGTRLDGSPLQGRARLGDGSILQVGRLILRVQVLAPDGLGLLNKAPTRRLRRRPVASSKAGEPPPTVIGSLADLARDELAADAPRRSPKRKRPSSTGSSGRSHGPRTPAPVPAPEPAPPPVPVPEPAAASVPQPAVPAPVRPRRRKRRSELESAPSVQVKPEVMRGAGRQEASPTPGRMDPSRRYGAGRSRSRDSAPMRPASRGRPSSMHEQLTDVLDANNLKDMVGERYVAAYERADASTGDPRGRYRPGREPTPTPGHDPLAARDPFGLHRQPTFPGGKEAGKLTGVLDIVGDKARLSRDRHSLDPDAMPEQLRAQQELERHRGRPDSVDDAGRQEPYRIIDDSRRLDPDDEQ